MPTTDAFEEALAAKLAAILPDEQSQAAARIAMDKHRAAVRRACTLPATMGKRVAKLAQADEELLEELEQLHPDHQHPTTEDAEEGPSIH